MRQLRWILAAVLGVSTATAQHYESAAVHVISPWSRAMPPVAVNGATYLQLRNHAATGDRLIEAITPIAGRVEFHSHDMHDGVARMRKVDSVELPSDEYVRFEPGGLHMMLLELKRPLVEGDRFPMTLRFANAGSLDIEVAVQAASAKDAGMHHEHGGHGHDAGGGPVPLRKP